MLLDVESVFAFIPFKLYESVYTHVVCASKLCERMNGFGDDPHGSTRECIPSGRGHERWVLRVDGPWFDGIQRLQILHHYRVTDCR